MRKSLFVLFVCLALSLPTFALPPVQHPDPPPDGGGSGGSCDYCTQYVCGCANAPVGYRLDFSCSCGTTCSRSCIYTPL
jgi:hypothetical protein